MLEEMISAGRWNRESLTKGLPSKPPLRTMVMWKVAGTLFLNAQRLRSSKMKGEVG